jgi:hypothetical protein
MNTPSGRGRTCRKPAQNRPNRGAEVISESSAEVISEPGAELISESGAEVPRNPHWDVMRCKEMDVDALTPRTRTGASLGKKRFAKEAFVYLPDRDAYRCPAGEMLTFRCHIYESDKSTNMKVGIYWTRKCGQCPLKSQCTSAQERRLRRWGHEDVIEAMDAKMAAMGNAKTVRKQTAEHPFGTLKMWMGAAPFLCKGLKKVRTEMSLSVLAYNLRRMIAILGVEGMKAALAR